MLEYMDMSLLQKRVADLQTSSQVNIKLCYSSPTQSMIFIILAFKNVFFCA